MRICKGALELELKDLYLFAFDPSNSRWYIEFKLIYKLHIYTSITIKNNRED